MRVVYSAEHLRHEPRHEVADGRALGIFEVPERAESIRRALEADTGFTFEEPTAHGVEPKRFERLKARRPLGEIIRAWAASPDGAP